MYSAIVELHQKVTECELKLLQLQPSPYYENQANEINLLLTLDKRSIIGAFSYFPIDVPTIFLPGNL